MTIEELMQMSKEDLEVTKENISDKSIKYSSIYHKYVKMKYHQDIEFSKLKIEREKVYGDLFHAYKFENKSGGYDLSTKTEIDIYVKKDPDFQKINLKYLKQEALLKFLEQTVENVKNMSYSFKNYVDIEKFQQGL